MPTGELDYCRLCADPKSNRDLVTIRARSRPAFEALLIEVFRIDLFANNSSLPRTVCTKCIDNVRMIGKSLLTIFIKITFYQIYQFCVFFQLF